MGIDNHSIRVEVNRTGTDGGPSQPEQPAPQAPVQPQALTPLIDIYEGPEGLILEADLPGTTDGDIHVQLEDNVLTLHARVRSPIPDGARALHEEYRPGDFSRSFILSDEVERTKIGAELKNGVLHLTLPKSERAKTRKIEIKS